MSSHVYMYNRFSVEHIVVAVIVWQLDLQLPMQSVPIVTKVGSNPVHGEMYSIQYYVIKCQWLAIGRWLTPVSSTNKTDRHDITKILLKVALNTINPTQIFRKACVTLVSLTSEDQLCVRFWLWNRNVFIAIKFHIWIYNLGWRKSSAWNCLPWWPTISDVREGMD